MATPYKIVLGPQDLGIYHKGGYNEGTAKKMNELLQHNLENWHILFSGLRHNHIVHCLFSAYGVGATAEELQEIYDREASYQTPRFPINEDDVKAMADKDKFGTYVGQPPHYSSFLLFFQREIEAKGVKATLEDHLFVGDDYANEFLTRLYTSIFHPYLHIGYAFEFNQPAIVAEALAMASVHDPGFTAFVPIYVKAEKAAGGPGQPGKKTLREIMTEARQNETLKKSIDGPAMVRAYNTTLNAPEEIIRAASEYSISEDQLEEKMNEMVDTVSLTIATKPQPLKESDPFKIDFFMLHSVNTLLLMPRLVDHPWITRSNGIRLLEWAGRSHLITYISETSPPLTTAEVDNYTTNQDWNEVFRLAITHPTDDGHLVKCIRCLAWAEKTLSPKHAQGKLLMRPESWRRLANLVIDHVPRDAKTSEGRWLLFF